MPTTSQEFQAQADAANRNAGHAADVARLIALQADALETLIEPVRAAMGPGVWRGAAERTAADEREDRQLRLHHEHDELHDLVARLNQKADHLQADATDAATKAAAQADWERSRDQAVANNQPPPPSPFP
jgi:hypothetical protein